MSPADTAPNDRRLGWTAIAVSVLGTLFSLGLHRAGAAIGFDFTRSALMLFGICQLVAIAIGRAARTEPAGKAGVVTGSGQLLLSLLLLG